MKKIILISFLLINLNLFSQNTPYTVSFSESPANIVTTDATGTLVSGNIKSVFNIKIPGYGRYNLKIQEINKPTIIPTFTTSNIATNNPLNILTLNARIRNTNQDSLISGTIHNISNIPYLNLSLIARNSKRDKGAYVSISIPLDGSKQGKVKKLRQTVLKKCNNHNDHDLTPETSQANTPLPKLYLNIDANSDWYNKFGSFSNYKIISIINEVKLIYKKQLGIELVIGRINTYTDQLSSTISLHQQLYDYIAKLSTDPSLASYDIHHILSASDMAHTPAGIAYTSTACRFPYAASGITRYIDGVNNAVTVVHEIGHNLGAPHDVNELSIMYPSITNPPSEHFSDKSDTDINNYLSYYGQNCGSMSISVSATSSTTNTNNLELKVRLNKKGKINIKANNMDTSCQSFLAFSSTVSGNYKYVQIDSNINTYKSKIRKSSNPIFMYLSNRCADNVTNSEIVTIRPARLQKNKVATKKIIKKIIRNLK